MEPLIGSIQIFAGNFSPRGWMFCQGQTLAIQQYAALFSILGVTYGGDGISTFALPDLRGRVPVGTGAGPGLPTIVLGQKAGEPNHTLTINEMPSHNHAATVAGTVNASSDGPSSSNPAGAFLATGNRSAPMDNIYAATNGRTAMGAGSISATATIGNTGSNAAHNNMQPYLGINYIIAVEGIYPSRN